MIAETQTEKTLAFEERRATPADRNALLDMYSGFEPKGAAMGLPPRKDTAKWLDELVNYPNFIAIVRGRLVGHSVLCTGGESAEIAVFVHQDYRGRGLGRALLKAMIEEARRLGVRRVWGIAEFDNIPMLRLAYSLGFVPGDDPREFSLDLSRPAPKEEYSPT